MHKLQMRREVGKVTSLHLMMHRLQVPSSRGDSVINSPTARGAASAINSNVKLKEASTKHFGGMKPQGSSSAMPWA
jgi:hypothetical protein